MNKPNTGVLFIQREKTSEKSPDFTGTVNIDGKDYRLAAWNKTSAKGVKYYSLAISDETFKPNSDVKPVVRASPALNNVQDEPINLDDIPF